MNRERQRTAHPSWEEARVWLLVVGAAAIFLAFLGVALSDSVVASAKMFSNTIAH